MTVESTINKSGPYAGAGSPGPFPVDFRFLDQTHLRVIKTDTLDLDADLVLTTDYTVAGVGAPTGSVTLTAPLASGEKLTIIRNVPITQEADYVQNDAFPAQSHEDALDKLTMSVQQLGEAVDRSMVLSPSAPSGISVVLPAPIPDGIIGWNHAATGLTNVDPGSLATVVAFGTAMADVFSGNGVLTSFGLTASPGAIANLDVSIGGVTQRPGIDYVWGGGATLAFTFAPPAGTNNILARYMQGLPQGVSDSAASQFLQAGTGSTPRSAQDKMRETVSVKDYGAIGDGTSCVAAVRKALTYLSSKGGGTLFFPDGLYGLDAASLIADPSPVTSLYRYWFQAVSNVTIKGGPGAVLRVDNGAALGDSAKQFCKGYQIFWAYNIATVDNFAVEGLTVDCNGANNLAPAKNGFGSGIQTHVVVTNCGTKWKVRDVTIKGTSGYQCVAFYLGASDIEIVGNRFYDMATAVPGNTLLQDHSSIYIEAEKYVVSHNRFVNTNYDVVATCIETHGFHGIVTKNYGHRYNLGMLRAAMLGDSYNVTNEGNVFSDVTVGVQFDAGAGRKLHALIKGNQFRFRDFGQRGGRTMSAVNTAGGFVARTGANYARVVVEGNSFTADPTATAAGVKCVIGGNVDWLEMRRNSAIGFTNYYEAGNFVDNSTVVIDGEYIESAVNSLVTHANYVAGMDLMHVDYRIADLDLAKSPGATFFLTCGFNNANIRYVSIKGIYSTAIAPYTGFFNVINTAFVVDYTTASLSAKGVAPFITGKIYDVAHRALFFRDYVAEPQRWKIRRVASAQPAVVFPVGDDHQGDIVDNNLIFPGSPVGWVVTNNSPGAGVIGTWAPYGVAGAVQAAHVVTTSGAPLANLEANVNDLITKLVAAKVVN